MADLVPKKIETTNNYIESIRSFLKNVWKATRHVRKNNLFLVGVVICFTWIFVAIFAAQLAPYDPMLDQDLTNRFQRPSSDYLFGTDVLGRDILSRVIYGSRISLTAGIITIVFAGILGIVIGSVAGYFGGWVDEALMRLADLFMAFPAIILAISIAAALGPSLFNSVIAITVVRWPTYARVMRSLVIGIKENEYVVASQALGASHFRIIWKDILPNSIAPVLVVATLDFGNALLTFSGLSFLGLGEAPPTPEWGSMVAEGAQYFSYWWIGTFPGFAIFTMAMGGNFVGDGLRDLLDPRLRKQI